MKITRIETLELGGFPNALWVRVHTNAGIVGCGETYYTPQATATYIHEIASKILFGQDPRQIEKLWWRQYEMSHISGNNGLEMRAISISLFYAAGTAIGGFIGPPLYGAMIESGSRTALFGAYAFAAVLMIVAALVTLFLGVDAERRPLEEVCAPLGAERIHDG